MTKTKTDSSLNLPDTITPAYIEKLVGALKEQKRLEIQQINQILLRVRRLLDPLPNVLEINVPEGLDITVVGDIHGQFFDLLHVFEVNKPPSDKNPYLFNGDWVDRGSFGTEICLLLFVYKLMNPDCIHLQRGNHESQQCTEDYGFKEEVLDKYNQTVYNNFIFIFNALPIASVINKDVYIVHGGLFAEDNIRISDINGIDRKVQPGGSEADKRNLMSQMLWADPDEENGVHESIRFAGCCSFGPDVTAAFLRNNKLKLIIRSHEMCEEGFRVTHNNQLITLFSAPSYCGNINKGAFIRIHSLPTSTSNLPSPHETSPHSSSSSSPFNSTSSLSSSSYSPSSSFSYLSSNMLPNATSVVSASSASLAFLLYGARTQSQLHTSSSRPGTRESSNADSSSHSLPPLPRSSAAVGSVGKRRTNRPPPNRRSSSSTSNPTSPSTVNTTVGGGFCMVPLHSPPPSAPNSPSSSSSSSAAAAATAGFTSPSGRKSSSPSSPLRDYALPSLSRGEADVEEAEGKEALPHAMFTSPLFPELTVFQYERSFEPPSKQYFKAPTNKFW